MTPDIPYTLNLQGKLIDLSTPQVMAIVNATPDSFYSESRFLKDKRVLEYVEQSLADGAIIIDVGAYSTRPMAQYIPEEEELNRLKPLLKLIRRHFPDINISVDTFRPTIAEYVVDEYNVQMVNDISGGEQDVRMFETIANLNVAYVLMHMRGTPDTMQQSTNYAHLISDILAYFRLRIEKLVTLGVKDIVIDPGFGFSKTLDQNYELLSGFSCLQQLGFPILVGMSRKSMIYKLLDIIPDQALNGTSTLNTIALLNGANILRVHDVKEAVETIKIVDKYFSQI
ncbi:MAG: dihydropteroate synthase [Paludibacteraceae bacterium]